MLGGRGMLKPELTGPPFFHLFIFIANFCLFCQKGKFLVLTALPFFSAFLGHSSLHQLRNPYSSPV